MNQHTLDVLEYDKIRELLVSYASSGLGKNLAKQIQPLTDAHRIEQLSAYLKIRKPSLVREEGLNKLRRPVIF